MGLIIFGMIFVLLSMFGFYKIVTLLRMLAWPDESTIRMLKGGMVLLVGSMLIGVGMVVCGVTLS